MSEQSDLEEKKKLLNAVVNAEEIKDTHRRARIAVTRRLGCDKAVHAMCVERGWPTDEDFVMVLALAVSFWMQGAIGQRLRRPKAADALGDRWPAAAFFASAKAIVDTLDLGELPAKIAGVREQDRA